MKKTVLPQKSLQFLAGSAFPGMFPHEKLNGYGETVPEHITLRKKYAVPVGCRKLTDDGFLLLP